jgi:cobalamin biosynthesis protein CobT
MAASKAELKELDVIMTKHSQMKGPISGLKRRIDLYGDTKIHTIRNQRRGKLDKKMLHKIPLGREDLFKNIIIDEDKPLDVCLLVDESGSMGYAKMTKARETAIALREALKDNQALNLWVFGHTADGYEWDGLGKLICLFTGHLPIKLS